MYLSKFDPRLVVCVQNPQIIYGSGCIVPAPNQPMPQD